MTIMTAMTGRPVSVFDVYPGLACLIGYMDMTSSLYAEISPTGTLKPCPISHQQLQQEINRSAHGQGKQYQKLRKQFLSGGTDRRYDKHEAAVELTRTDKRVYQSSQVKRRTRVKESDMRPYDDRQIRKPVNPGNAGLDFELRMHLLHQANNK